MMLLLGYIATFICGLVAAYVVYTLATDEANKVKTETEQEWLDRQW